jgi:hypothetical protein
LEIDEGVHPWRLLGVASGAAREADFVIASRLEGFVVASEWRALMVGATTKAGLFCASGGEGFVEVAADMPLEKWTAEEGASGGEDFDFASEVEDLIAATEAGFGGGAALWAGLLCASEEEGFVLPREERALRVLLQEMQASGEVPRQRRACSVPSLRRRALGGR